MTPADFTQEDIDHAARFLGCDYSAALRWLEAQEAKRLVEDAEDAAFWGEAA